MWCLLLVAALPGDDRLSLESEERLHQMDDDTAGFQALDRKTARIKQMQDATRVELAQLRKEFGGPSSLAELPKDFADEQLHVAATDTAVEAGLDSLERKLDAQEKADAKDRAKRHAEEFEQSLLETGWKKHAHTKGWKLPASLRAEHDDYRKTKAIQAHLHEQADAARKRFHATIDKDLEEVQEEKDLASGANDDSHVDAETKEELEDEDAASSRVDDRESEDAESFAELGSQARYAVTEDTDKDDVETDIKLRERASKLKFQQLETRARDDEQRYASEAKLAKQNEAVADKKAKAARAKLEAEKVSGRKKVEARIAQLKKIDAERVAVEEQARADHVPGTEAR